MSIINNDSPVGVVVAKRCGYFEPARKFAEKLYPLGGIEEFGNLFFCAGIVGNVVERDAFLSAKRLLSASSFGLAGRLLFLASGMTDRVYRCD